MCMQKYEYLIVLFLIYFKCYSFFSTFWTYYSVSTQFSMFKWQLSNRCRIVATLATNWDHRINKSDWIVFQSDPRFFGVRCLKGIIIRPPDREWVDCMDVLYRLETGENRTALSGQHLIPEVAAPYPALDVFEIGATWPGKSGKNSVFDQHFLVLQSDQSFEGHNREKSTIVQLLTPTLQWCKAGWKYPVEDIHIRMGAHKQKTTNIFNINQRLDSSPYFWNHCKCWPQTFSCCPLTVMLLVRNPIWALLHVIPRLFLSSFPVTSVLLSI